MKTIPSEHARAITAAVMMTGSRKDGISEMWRDQGSLFHLVKAASHLAKHIKHLIDPRGKDKENHLYKAITRLAMAAAIEQDKK